MKLFNFVTDLQNTAVISGGVRVVITRPTGFTFCVSFVATLCFHAKTTWATGALDAMCPVPKLQFLAVINCRHLKLKKKKWSIKKLRSSIIFDTSLFASPLCYSVLPVLFILILYISLSNSFCVLRQQRFRSVAATICCVQNEHVWHHQQVKAFLLFWPSTN